MLKIYIGTFLFCLQSLFICAQNYKFTWEGALTGIKAVWAEDDTTNTYVIPELGIKVKVSIIDPFKKNTNTGNLSEFGDCTKTNTFYGSGNLAFQITSEASGQPVCLKFEFDKAIYLRGFKIYDIDMKQNISYLPSSFQDSVMLVAKRSGVDIPLRIDHMSESHIYTIYGQAVKADFIAGVNNDLDYNDLKGAISVSSADPLTEFTIYFSNGYEDDGISNSQALKIPGFDFEVFQSPLPVKISDLNIEKGTNESYWLAWTANSEINNDIYTISTSSDGINFTKFGVLKSLNLSNHRYSYDLGQILNQHLYVKLEQTDFDGATKFLGIVDVKSISEGKLATLKSTVVTNQLYINVSDAVEDFIRWEIYDMQGRSITVGSIRTGDKDIDTQTLNSGSYILKVSTPYASESFKFIKY
jgi:hypothetical protein